MLFAMSSAIFLTGCTSMLGHSTVKRTHHEAPISTVSASESNTESESSPLQIKEAQKEIALETKEISKFLELLSDTDLMLIKKEAKRTMSIKWHHIDKRAQLVRHRVLQTLEAMQAPTELQFIPVAESGYNPYALSPAGALGLWQLMPRTAKFLGVHHKNGIDNRRHIEESTQGAAKYMLRLHERFNSWPLAICAYNLGPSGVERRLRKKPWLPEDGLDNLPLPAETRHYVKQVLGMIAMAEEEKLHFSEPTLTESILIPAPIDLTELEKLSGLKKNELFRFNPELDFQHYINNEVTLHLPLENIEKLEIALFTDPDVFKPKFISIRIQEGDSLWMLAKKHHTSIRHLEQLNPNLGKLLSVGKTMVVPASNSFSVAASKANPLLSTGRRIRYKVKNGDSLWKIAKKFGTTSHAIARTNQMPSNRLIRPGDKIWVIARLQPS